MNTTAIPTSPTLAAARADGREFRLAITTGPDGEPDSLELAERRDGGAEVIVLQADGPQLAALRRVLGDGLPALRLQSPAQRRIAAARERHPNAFRPWTHEDDALLLELHGRGEPLAEIAVVLGRAERGTRMRLERHHGIEQIEVADL